MESHGYLGISILANGIQVSKLTIKFLDQKLHTEKTTFWFSLIGLICHKPNDPQALHDHVRKRMSDRSPAKVIWFSAIK